MAAYKQFDANKLILRYFPDDKVIFLLPKPGMQKHFFNLVKNKLETFLQVDSVKQENGGLSLKLSPNTAFSPEDLFRSFGFQGGTDVEDASSVASAASEADAEEEKEQTPPPNANPLMAPPGQPGEDPLTPQQESLRLLLPLYEDFWKPLKKKARTGMTAPAKRTGKYWRFLEKNLGKKRAKIKEEDVLRLRKKFGNQPYSYMRNKSLLALDKAYRYFLIKIGREKGDGPKAKFKQDYLSQSNLEASDYKPNAHKEIDNPTFGGQDNLNPNDVEAQMSIQGNFNIPDEAEFDDEDVEEDEDDAGVGYDDIEIEDLESVPTL